MNSSMIASLVPPRLDCGTLRIRPRCFNSTSSSAVLKFAIVSVGSEEKKRDIHHYSQKCCTYMWQSRVEIERYSIVQFDCVTVFEAL